MTEVLRPVQLVTGILCIVLPGAAALIVSGGASQLIDIASQSISGANEQDASLSFLVLVLAPPLAGLPVGLYLLVRRLPTRPGLVLSMVAMVALVLLDFLLLFPRSPILIPSLVSHGLLLALVGLLLGARSRSDGVVGTGRDSAPEGTPEDCP
jgi:hypothetical protein